LLFNGFLFLHTKKTLARAGAAASAASLAAAAGSPAMATAARGALGKLQRQSTALFVCDIQVSVVVCGLCVFGGGGVA
jgi:hypothetical protein